MHILWVGRNFKTILKLYFQESFSNYEKLTISCVDKNVDEWEFLYTADGNVT